MKAGSARTASAPTAPPPAQADYTVFLLRAALLALLAATALHLAACNSTNSTTDRGGDAQANPVSTGAPEQTRKKAAPPGTGG